MQYRLRTLLIVLALGPPLLAIPAWRRAAEWERQVNCSNGYVSPAVRKERDARREAERRRAQR
jgi:hypothetical protein